MSPSRRPRSVSENDVVFPPAPDPLRRTPRMRGVIPPSGAMVRPAAWLDSTFPIPARTDHRIPVHRGRRVPTVAAARV
ncbi:hypothetical protein AMK17_38130 [Streptomyces sp. CB00072]|nr:hypothetical protein AMK17_38130 [Streptomyces sp. CB00072]